MNKLTSLLLKILLLFPLLGIELSAQLDGMWLVDKVMVGNQKMTPVARWTKINSDSTFQGGNGWLQNSEGKWSIDENNKISFDQNNGIKHEFGGFKYKLREDKMIWEREENGELVIVNLSRIKELPKSTADMIVGIWDLKSKLVENENVIKVFDPDDNYNLFIRWDRIYIEWNSNGERSTGYWFINAHRPDLDLISHSSNNDKSEWTIEVSESELILTGRSESSKNVKMIFDRTDQFPN